MRAAPELRSRQTREHLYDICQHSAAAVTKLVTTTKKHLATRRPEEVGKTLVDRDAEIASRMTGMRNLETFKNGAKRHKALKHEFLSLLWQNIEMDTYGSEFDRHPVAPSVQYRGTNQIIANPRSSRDIKIDLAAMKLTQSRSHVLFMDQKPPLLISESSRFNERHSRANAADAVKKNERCQDVLVGTGDIDIRCSGHTGDAEEERNHAAGGPPAANLRA